jgi:hypothetical protein
VNIEHLRKSLKAQWLGYYRNNRDWLTRLGIWVNCEGKRRPSSSFILGTLSTLEPQLTQMLPLVVDLSSNPDRIVIALGLNFNPDDELAALAKAEKPSGKEGVKMLPSGTHPVSIPEQPRRAIDSVELSAQELPERDAAHTDEACEGVRGNSAPKKRWD